MRPFSLTIGGVLLPALLVACGADVPPPGSDTDQQGCKRSAGYSWCAGTGQCERPWELADAQGFERSEQAFDAFCDNPPAAGQARP